MRFISKNSLLRRMFVQSQLPPVKAQSLMLKPWLLVENHRLKPPVSPAIKELAFLLKFQYFCLLCSKLLLQLLFLLLPNFRAGSLQLLQKCWTIPSLGQIMGGNDESMDLGVPYFQSQMRSRNGINSWLAHVLDVTHLWISWFLDANIGWGTNKQWGFNGNTSRYGPMSSQLSPATVWLLGGWLTILKNMSQLGKLFSYMKWTKIINKFQTTNQYIYIDRGLNIVLLITCGTCRKLPFCKQSCQQRRPIAFNFLCSKVGLFLRGTLWQSEVAINLESLSGKTCAVLHVLSSGKLTVCYAKSPSLIGKLTN